VYGLGEKALASLHRTSGELESAEAHVRKAIAELEGTPALLAEAWVELAHIQLVRGDFPASLASIDEAEGIAERLGGSAELGPGEFELMTIRAEALHGRNQPQEARSVVKQALERLEERASCISSDEWRKSFLERVSVHRRLFQLAEDWGVDRAT
jgi:tetratricopeptide (TPR) repeat protein